MVVAAVGVGVAIAGVAVGVFGAVQQRRMMTMQLQAQAMNHEAQFKMGRISSSMQKDMVSHKMMVNKIKFGTEKYFINKAKETNKSQYDIFNKIINHNVALAELTSWEERNKAYEALSESYYSFVNRGFTLSSGKAIHNRSRNAVDRYFKIEAMKRESVKSEQKIQLMNQKYGKDNELLQQSSRMEQQMLSEDVDAIASLSGLTLNTAQQSMGHASSMAENTAMNIRSQQETFGKVTQGVLSAANIYLNYKASTTTGTGAGAAA